MDWTVDPTADTPPWRQLVQKVLDALATGQLEAGDALLSVRKMAASALVNANTVARAYRELEQLGVVAGQNGRGVFVTTEGPELARNLRQQATWRDLREAWLAALRAGHSPDELRAGLEGPALENLGPEKHRENHSAAPRQSNAQTPTSDPRKSA